MKALNFEGLKVWFPLGLLALNLAACGGKDDDEGSDSSAGGTSSMAAGGGGGTGTAKGGAGPAKGGSPSTATGGSAGAATGGTGPAPGGGELDTGLPDDKLLSSLTDAEVDQFCGDVDEFSVQLLEDLDAFACAGQGLAAALESEPANDAAAQAACKTAYDECLANPNPADGGGEAAPCTKEDASCTASVGEAEACLNDIVEFLDLSASSLPACASLTLSQLEGLDNLVEPEQPESCKLMESKCP